MELKKMYPPQKDSPSTFTLGDITPTDVLVTVANAAVLPQVVPFPLTLGIDKTNTETVMVTEINTMNNQLKITRAPGALSWLAGAKVARVFNAADLKTVHDNIVLIGEVVDNTDAAVKKLQNEKLDKSIVTDAVYTTNATGEQTMTPASANNAPNTLAKRDASGQLVVTAPTTPTSAANKEFVEGLIKPLSTDKVDRTELPQVITDWTYSPDGTKLLVTITRYNASNKTTSTFTKIIPAVSDSTIGVMTPEAYNEITALRNDVAALQQQGGRFIGVSFATKANLDAYKPPASTSQGDFTYVLDDETHAGATTRYIFNIVTKKFDFGFIVEADPIGLATSEQAGIVKGTSLTQITKRNAVSDRQWQSVCYGNGLFVAVASSGTGDRVMTSPDGIVWTSLSGVSALAENEWVSICFGDGIFMAVARTGEIATSPNGKDWTIRYTATTHQAWSSVCYGNGKFVIVGNPEQGECVMTFINDVFAPQSSPLNNWQSICYGSGLFAAVAGDSEDGGSRVMTSPDGIDWTARDCESKDWKTICYGNGMFVVFAGSNATHHMVSSNGISWEFGGGPFEADWRSIAYGNGMFVAVATSATEMRLMTSSNGRNWESPEVDSAFASWSSVCFGDDKFVGVSTVGASGNANNRVLVVASPNGKAYVEADGTLSVIGWDKLTTKLDNLEDKVDALPRYSVATVDKIGLVKDSPEVGEFVSRTSAADNQWLSVCYGNGLFVAVASSGTGNRVMTSPDGITWTSRTSAANNGWRSVCYGNGLFVTVAEFGTGNRVMTSSDGINWTSHTAAADNSWLSVCYGNGLFVAMAGTGNRVMTSPDGITWTSRTHAADNQWNSVCYGNGLFVAVAGSGTGNRVMTSPDGITWTSRTSAADYYWLSVCYGNGLFVAVAGSGANRVMTSPDGITWTSRTHTTDYYWLSVCYGNGLFVAVASGGSGNRVMTSPDGITWASRTHAADYYWNSVCYGNGLFVAVAQSGTGNRVMAMEYSPKVEIDMSGQMTAKGLQALRADTDTITNEVLRLQAKTSQNDVIVPDLVSPTAITSSRFDNPRDNQQYTFRAIGNNDGAAVTINRKPLMDISGNPDKIPKLLTGHIYTIFWDVEANCFFLKASASAEGNAVAEDVLAGKTFSNENVSGVAGTLMVGEGATPPRELKPWAIRASAADNSWYSVCYGNGMFVAVASGGTGNRVMTSPDGINWTSRTSAADNIWKSVCYGKGLFVAVAASGIGNRVMTSPDGIVWTSRTSAADNSWQSVCYDNGMFVAVASGGTGNRVVTSPDGITWTSRTTAANHSWQSVCYGNGLFVAVADSGTGNRVMTSPDGITWTSRTSAADNSWQSVCYGNGLFVAVADTGTGNRVMTSPDGINWTSRTSAANNWQSVCYGNGLFVAVALTGSGNRVMTSPDGITWAIRASAADNQWNSVCYGNGMFVAVASGGTGTRIMTMSYSLEEVPNKISTGVNLKEFVSRTSAADNQWLSVCYGNGLFVAVAISGIGNRVMTSPDGITWTSRTSAANNGWRSVCYGNGLFVAVADSGTGNCVMTSPDGITWTSRTSTADYYWQSVCYGNGLFVAVDGSGRGNCIMTSPDGITWTIRTSAADNVWLSVCYGNGLFVAVASGGKSKRVMTSPDGIDWTIRTSTADYYWNSVCYGNGMFVAVAGSGTGNRVMTSPDGITWTSRTHAADYYWNSVCYGNGMFVAVAQSGSGNRVMTSPDGITWTSRTSAADNQWASVCYGNGMFVAVASGGVGNRVMTAEVVRQILPGVSKNVQQYSLAASSISSTQMIFNLKNVVPDYSILENANIIPSLYNMRVAAGFVEFVWSYDRLTGILSCTTSTALFVSTLTSVTIWVIS